MATTAPDRIERWTRTERAFHWVHASAFLVLLGSGLCLYLPSLAEEIGRRPLLKTIHDYTALAWLLALFVLFMVGDRRSLRNTVTEVDHLGMESRMNRRQKLNTIIQAAFAILFSVTGFFLWYGERNTRFRLSNALLVHDWLMYVAVVLFIGHLSYALIFPSTRHSLNGMVRGWVRMDWAARRHPAWVRELRGD